MYATLIMITVILCMEPVTARAHTLWQEKGFSKFVIDNNADYYIVKSVDSQKICNEIRENNMDFTS